jgi:hypothetical protein
MLVAEMVAVGIGAAVERLSVGAGEVAGVI